MWQLFNHIQRLIGGDIHFVVISFQMFGHGGSVLGLIVFFFPKSDAERLDRSVRHLLHQRYDHGRVDAPRQQCPKLYVRHHAVSNRLLQYSVQLVDRAFITPCESISLTVFGNIFRGPELGWVRLPRLTILRYL